MAKHFFLLIPILLVCGVAQAQEVQLNEPSEITQMVKAWANFNRTNPRVDGWRVQIMASTDRTQVESGKTRFESLYPHTPADWIHEKPYYKLRVGAFRSRQEAIAFISGLAEFPGAYPAKDPNIHPRDFLE
jgi:hypothetical protein